MNIWSLLMPLEYFLLAGLLLYLIRLERRNRYLRRQEKRMRRAKEMPRLAEELIQNSTVSE
ncbi:MAG: hypothetical protein ACUVXD_17770 [Thermodesulfobacteriota bacterium]